MWWRWNQSSVDQINFRFQCILKGEKVEMPTLQDKKWKAKFLRNQPSDSIKDTRKPYIVFALKI